MKVGVYCHGFMEWGGGIDFIRIIVQSLLIAAPSDLDIHVLIPDVGVHGRLRQAKAQAKKYLNIVRGRPNPQLLFGTAEKFIRQSLGEDQHKVHVVHVPDDVEGLKRAVRRLSLDVLLPSTISLGRDFPIPWIGYLYDFQHRYLSQYFTLEVCETRNVLFGEMLDTARVVVVNAKAVAADAAKFYPQAPAQVVALPYSVAPDPDWLKSEPSLVERFGIAAPYFMISNQFYLHKRHDVAFAAFNQLLQTHPDVRLVCTGETHDWRAADYLPSLLAQLDKWGIRDKVKILGLIAKREQIELMRGAVAVVQPTGFEGGPGGGAVNDAVSIGTPAIVSDIPVNLEIEPFVWRYFTYGDASSLTNAMTAILTSPPERGNAAALLEEGRQRRRNCGNALIQAIEDLIALSRPRAN